MMIDFRPPASHKGRGRGREPSPALTFLGGRQFGDLTFVGEAPSRSLQKGDGQRYVRMGRFRCACGGKTVAELRNVKRGFTQSCGCKEGKRRHG